MFYLCHVQKPLKKVIQIINTRFPVQFAWLGILCIASSLSLKLSLYLSGSHVITFCLMLNTYRYPLSQKSPDSPCCSPAVISVPTLKFNRESLPAKGGQLLYSLCVRVCWCCVCSAHCSEVVLQ